VDSAYRIMWMFIFFDLPTLTSAQRKEHTTFRKKLEKMGFMRAQLSVYMYHFASMDSAEAQKQRIKNIFPPQGHIRILLVTDKQFAKMEVFHCTKKMFTEQPRSQVLLF
jgi:CRISPR-associated protein Cas2